MTDGLTGRGLAVVETRDDDEEHRGDQKDRGDENEGFEEDGGFGGVAWLTPAEDAGLEQEEPSPRG